MGNKRNTRRRQRKGRRTIGRRVGREKVETNRVRERKKNGGRGKIPLDCEGDEEKTLGE